MLSRQNQIRQKVQEQGSELAKQNKMFLCELPTGSGKGRLCMMAIDRIESDRKWLVVVPEIIQIENMRRDIAKHGFTHLYEQKIEDIICYASLSKYRGRKLNLWFNEAHRLSSLKEDIAQTIDYERIIADSATVPNEVLDRLYSLGDFHRFHMSLDEAIRMGLLPDPAIHVIYTRLDDTTKKYMAKYKSGSYPMTEKRYVRYLEEQMEYWKQNDDGFSNFASVKINRLGGERKKVIAESKTEHVRKFLKTLGNRKFLCYGGSVEQCQSLGGDLAISSKRSKKHNLTVLKDFNEGRITQIYMNKMGREGMNLEGIEVVVMIQLSSGKDEGLEWIQKAGRGLRSLAPELYMFVCKDSVDETYLRRTLNILDKKRRIIYHDS